MKSLSCREAGKDCDYIAKGKNEDEVTQKAMLHAMKAHGAKKSDFTPEAKQKMRSLVKDDAARRAS